MRARNKLKSAPACRIQHFFPVQRTKNVAALHLFKARWVLPARPARAAATVTRQTSPPHVMAPVAPCTALAVATLSVVLAVSAASARNDANDPTFRTDWRTMPRERAVPAHVRGRRAFGDTDYGTPTPHHHHHHHHPQRGLGHQAAEGTARRLIAPSATVPCLPHCPGRHYDGRGVDGHARLRVYVAAPHQ